MGPLQASPPGAINDCPSEDKKPSPTPVPFGVNGTGLANGLRFGFGLRGAIMPSSLFRRLRSRRTARMSKIGSKMVLNRLCRGAGGGRMGFWAKSTALGVEGILASPIRITYLEDDYIEVELQLTICSWQGVVIGTQAA